ncbi:MAG TPA: ATP-binding protein [Polyangiales bacterium]|nr:ATP-binding protein [Polyangiales bacterium]
MEISRVAFETARLRLARYRLEGEQARSRAAAHATQVSADALDVDRVGLWLFRRHDQVLTCVCQYDRKARKHSAGQELVVKDYPTYMRALREHRVIAAEDALTHPLTSELAAGYLAPSKIASLLDAPIIRDGRVLGVVCHEHVGEQRAWGERDLEFASAVADMVTLIFEQADRLELEAALQEQAEQRQESQKMEALGRMACGVAHDFNNVLGVISVSLGAFSRIEAEHPQLRGTSQRVEEMVKLGQRLTHQLLAFGRERQEIGNETTDFAELLAHIRGLLESAVGSRIQLALDVRVTGARVEVESSQLEQLVLNLVLNARDAIPDAGTVELVLREARPEDEVAPDSLVFEVRDDGSGMDAQTCARMFEPYFTTKPRGNGLGLATVYGIVRRAGGTARAVSEPGRGTTVLVALPRAYQA